MKCHQARFQHRRRGNIALEGLKIALSEDYPKAAVVYDYDEIRRSFNTGDTDCKMLRFALRFNNYYQHHSS